MSMFDKAKDLLGQHADKVEEGVAKVGDLIDEKTGGQHTDKIDSAQAKINEELRKLDDTP